MNLLASVALSIRAGLPLDAGIFVAFIGFLLFDMIVKRFGAKAAIRVTVLGFIVNLAVAGLFTLVAVIANASGQYYPLADYATLTQWWIIGASAIAFLISNIVDALIHELILKRFKKNKEGIVAHATSAWSSTFFGQTFDNLLFDCCHIPRVNDWVMGMKPMSLLGLVGFALVGGIAELLWPSVIHVVRI